MTVLIRKIEKDISGSVVRSSTTTKAASSAAAAAKRPSVVADVQPKSFAFEIANTAVERPEVTSTAPRTSKLFACASRLSASSSGVSAIAARATGMLMKKIHSQLRRSVKMPPSSTPAAAPKPPTAPQTPRAMFRSRPSRKVVVRIDSAAGEMTAAPRPCRARAPIREGALHASPATSEPAAKSDEPEEEDAPAAEQVGGAPAEQQEATERECVGADHPLQVLLREAEVELDRGKSDVDDCDVEHDHELDDAEERQCEPSAIG